MVLAFPADSLELPHCFSAPVLQTHTTSKHREASACWGSGKAAVLQAAKLWTHSISLALHCYSDEVVLCPGVADEWEEAWELSLLPRSDRREPAGNSNLVTQSHRTLIQLREKRAELEGHLSQPKAMYPVHGALMCTQCREHCLGFVKARHPCPQISLHAWPGEPGAWTSLLTLQRRDEQEGLTTRAGNHSSTSSAALPHSKR